MQAGVGTINSTGALTAGTQDRSGSAQGSSTTTNLQTALPLTGGVTLTIDNSNGTGTGNAGSGTVVMTNGAKIFLLDEGRSDATITTIEK